jgi:hypothetical protein
MCGDVANKTSYPSSEIPLLQNYRFGSKRIVFTMSVEGFLAT